MRSRLIPPEQRHIQWSAHVEWICERCEDQVTDQPGARPPSTSCYQYNFISSDEAVTWARREVCDRVGFPRCKCNKRMSVACVNINGVLIRRQYESATVTRAPVPVVSEPTGIRVTHAAVAASTRTSSSSQSVPAVDLEPDPSSASAPAVDLEPDPNGVSSSLTRDARLPRPRPRARASSAGHAARSRSP